MNTIGSSNGTRYLQVDLVVLRIQSTDLYKVWKQYDWLFQKYMHSNNCDYKELTTFNEE